jgi:gas vesicle protein
MFVKKRSAKDTGKKMAVSALIAGVGGYITGVLTAPKSGKETRRDLVEDAEGLKDSTEDQLKRANDELKSLLNDTKTKSVALSAQAREEFNEAVLRAKDAQNKTSTTLKALKAGKAEDPELNKAVKQARLAVKNLSKYFKG